MRLPKENPPRFAGETAIYEDDPFELGEIEEGRFVRVKDFLPSPEELIFKNPQRKITITLDQMSIDFFKAEAKSLQVPYQRLIRSLIANYAQTKSRERKEAALYAATGSGEKQRSLTHPG